MDNVSAASITSMRCGGVVARVLEPDDVRELAGLVGGLETYHVLGAGTNTIFADDTIRTPVIRLGRTFDFIEPVAGGIRAGGATPVKRILSHCIRTGLTGLEFMAGIPGTLGGAVYMNAGTANRGIMEAVDSLEIVDKDGLRTVAPGDVGYGYRSGGIPPNAVVTSCVLRLELSTPGRVRSLVLEHLGRRRTQPHEPSAGSVFKNPPQAPAGALIDQAGLKGLRAGGAMISVKHANFIVNMGGAKTSDITRLIDIVKNTVKRRFGVDLVEEVRIIGH